MSDGQGRFTSSRRSFGPGHNYKVGASAALPFLFLDMPVLSFIPKKISYSYHPEDGQHRASVGMNVARIDAVVAEFRQPLACSQRCSGGVNNALRCKLPGPLKHSQSLPIGRPSMFANRRDEV